jgi:DNA-binding NarL/FixJ family response regulator
MRFAVLSSDAERRDGLKALLRQIDRHARFCEAHDWAQTDRILRRLPANLLAVDWQEGMHAEHAASLLAEHQRMPVAVFVDDVAPASVRPLVTAGVHGVIPRLTKPQLIIRLLELVLAGGHYAPHGAFLFDLGAAPNVPALPSLPSPHPTHELAEAAPRRRRLAPVLSPRQEQIMRCVHMGSTNKMIARTLGISEGTVKIHLASIFQQLGAPNRAAAVAIYNGWLMPHLEVLRPENERMAEPMQSSTALLPLPDALPFKYPLPSNDNDGALPLAAEPDAPFKNSTENTS